MMFKIFLRISFVLCCAFAATPGHAQQAPTPSVSLPVMGFVLDQAGGLRPVIGISGAASIGTAIDVGFGIAQAAVPPGHDYVLAVASSSNRPVLLQTRGNAITVVPNAFGTNDGPDIEDCRDPAFDNEGPRARCRAAARAKGVANISAIALSPSGSSAALFSASQGRIYAFTNLTQSPTSAGSFDVAALGSVTAFGISEDARTIVFGVSDGNAGSLYLISAQQQARLLTSIHHASSIQFMHNSDGAVIADDMDNTIYALTGGQVYAMAGPNDGIAGPVGIGVSNNNQKVFIANSVSSSVTTIALSGASMQSTACNCALTGLKPTNSDSVFQLTDFSGGPILLFDGNSATPRTIFVPAAAQF